LGLYPSADRHGARRRRPHRSCGGGSGAASSPESAPGPTGTPATVVLRMLASSISPTGLSMSVSGGAGSLVYRAFCGSTANASGRENADPAGASSGRTRAQGRARPTRRLGRKHRVIRGRACASIPPRGNQHPLPDGRDASGRWCSRPHSGLRRIGEQVRERTRSVARRVFEIAQRSRSAGHRVPAECARGARRK